MLPDEGNVNGSVEHRNLTEFGSFSVSGPSSVGDIIARVGAGKHPMSADRFDLRGLRWELFVHPGEAAS